jgi:hypothetical protein
MTLSVLRTARRLGPGRGRGREYDVPPSAARQERNGFGTGLGCGGEGGVERDSATTRDRSNSAAACVTADLPMTRPPMPRSRFSVRAWRAGGPRNRHVSRRARNPVTRAPAKSTREGVARHAPRVLTPAPSEPLSYFIVDRAPITDAEVETVSNDGHLYASWRDNLMSTN